MSLDTVIKIGKFYRQDKNAWKFHVQINWAYSTGLREMNSLD